MEGVDEEQLRQFEEDHRHLDEDRMNAYFLTVVEPRPVEPPAPAPEPLDGFDDLGRPKSSEAQASGTWARWRHDCHRAVFDTASGYRELLLSRGQETHRFDEQGRGARRRHARPPVERS